MDLLNLKQDEKFVIDSVLQGKVADFCHERGRISGKFIRELCSFAKMNDTHKTTRLHGTTSRISHDYEGLIESLLFFGLRINNAEIFDQIDLSYLHLPFPLHFTNCLLTEEMDLCYAHLGGLKLDGSRCRGISAQGITIVKDVQLGAGFSSTRSICFVDSIIHGNFFCVQSTFESDREMEGNTQFTDDECRKCKEYFLFIYSIDLGRSRIAGCVHFCGGFNCSGGVNLADTNVGGNVNCTKGVFKAKNIEQDLREKKSGMRLKCETDYCYHELCAFNAEGLKVGGHLIMNTIEVYGETRLTCASVHKDQEASGSIFSNPGHIALHGDRLKVEGNLYLFKKTCFTGTVRLPRAQIGTDLSFTDSVLHGINEDSAALYCKGTSVGGSLYMDRAVIRNGYFDFSGSTMKGNISAINGQFLNTGRYAIKGEYSNIEGSLWLKSSSEKNKGKSGDTFTATSQVFLHGMTVGMDLDCWNGLFIFPDYLVENHKKPYAINGDGMEILGNCFMSGKKFSARGGVGLTNTRIKGFLDLDGAEFTAYYHEEDAFAIGAGKLVVDGSVYLVDGFKANGVICFNDAVIGRNLVLRKGEISAMRKYSFRGEQMHVAGRLMLDRFTSNGEFRIDYSHIGTNVECLGSSFINTAFVDYMSNRGKPVYAFRANGVKIDGDLIFNKKEVRDDHGSTVSVEYLNLLGIVSIKKSKIGLCLHWKGVSHTKEHTNCAFILDLESTTVGKYEDEMESWPLQGNLSIDSFRYNDLQDLYLLDEDYAQKGKNSENNKLLYNIAKSRLKWLKRGRLFNPQPYDYLAEILKKAGFYEESKVISIEKCNLLKKRPILRWLDKRDLPINHDGMNYPSRQSIFTYVFSWVYGFLTRYGYRPHRAIGISLVLVLAGAFFFSLGFKSNDMVMIANYHGDIHQVALVDPRGLASDRYKMPEKLESDLNYLFEDLGLVMYALGYSFDTFMPVINFHFADFWLPSAYPTKLENTDKVALIVEKERGIGGREEDALGYSDTDEFEKNQSRVIDVKPAFSGLGLALCIYRWLLIFCGWLISIVFIAAVGNLVR